MTDWIKNNWWLLALPLLGLVAFWVGRWIYRRFSLTGSLFGKSPSHPAIDPERADSERKRIRDHREAMILEARKKYEKFRAEIEEKFKDD